MLKLFNTLTNQKEIFQPLEKGKVKMYNCGPTVYDYAHVGNWRSFLTADLLRRYLEFSGYEVKQIMNITDVGHLTEDNIGQADTGEDKMLKAALREKKDPLEIAQFYTEVFFHDAQKLNIKKAAYYPRATAHIDQMIKIIAKLLEKGLAYEKNGNVFYAVQKFASYGKLSGKKLEKLKIGARLEEHPDKKNPFDFALWLKAPKEHLLKWESPWSLGYPGWHIECSAMAMEYLGTTIDIHTGGEDHIFPHHENEIAQSEGYSGQEFSRFWLHTHFMLVDNQKMSKSKGNFFTLQDLINQGFAPMAFRLLILSSHYRSQMNFTLPAMRQAQKNWEKLERFVRKMQEVARQKTVLANRENLDFSLWEQKINAALDDDLNSPLALSHLYELISLVNRDLADGVFDAQEAESALNFWQKINTIFGFQLETKKTLLSEKDTHDQKLKSLLSARKTAKEKKDYVLADQIRDKIKTLGYSIEDTTEGQVLKKITS